MDKIITNSEARQLYRECMNHPNLIDELSNYEKQKIIPIVKNKLSANNSKIIGMIKANPDYDYPAEYTPDHLYEYWQERLNCGETNKLEQFIQELNTNHNSKKDSVSKENENIPYSLIREFAEYFSEDAEYSVNAIETYLIEWYPRKSFTYFRSKAKKAAVLKCDELKTAKDGTMRNWEDQCTKFLHSRTGKKRKS